MNDLATEWIEKAESDYRTAEREGRVRKGPSYAVHIRYPGDSATKEEARDAVRAMRLVRYQVRQKLGLVDP